MATLFVNTDLVIRYFKIGYKINATEAFIDCADKQLTAFFEKQTGLRVNKHISISLDDDKFYYEKDVISKIPTRIYVNHNWNPVTILWQSKSGRVYNFEDTDIDCSDIVFWFEGLDPLLYHKQLYPKDELPFKLKNLSYELVITRLNMDCSIDMCLRSEVIADAEKILKEVDVFLDAFNEKALKNDHSPVIHNWKRNIVEGKLVYEIDTGSAGPDLLKKLLPFLSKKNYFDKVEVW